MTLFMLIYFPKGPSSSIVYTWALKEFLYPYFGAYVMYVLYSYLDPLGLLQCFFLSLTVYSLSSGLLEVPGADGANH